MNKSFTIGNLGQQSGLSRSTLLYYDRLGLLRPLNRSGSNYRLYSPADAERLKQICFYRRMGIPLKEIARLLGHSRSDGPTEQILRRRLEHLEHEIESLQNQQREILRLLEQFSMRTSTARRGETLRPQRAPATGNNDRNLKFKENAMINKQRWVEIMSAAGFSEQDKQRWHRSFEKMEPQGHQEFLESLGLNQQEIAQIREWSRK